MKFNWFALINILGVILMFNAGFMGLCLPFALYYDDQQWQPLLTAAAVTLAGGGIPWLLTRRRTDQELRSRDGYLVVTLSWVLMSFTGSLPYIFSETIPGYPDAFLESMSGFTTTGATILTDIEALPKGILFLAQPHAVDRRHGYHCAGRGYLAHLRHRRHATVPV